MKVLLNPQETLEVPFYTSVKRLFKTKPPQFGRQLWLCYIQITFTSKGFKPPPCSLLQVKSVPGTLQARKLANSIVLDWDCYRRIAVDYF